MLIDTLKSLFLRDLEQLKAELESYRNEALIWQMDGHIANSAGNLCLHLVGNLNTYIGGELGKTGYVRDVHPQRRAPRSTDSDGGKYGSDD